MCVAFNPFNTPVFSRMMFFTDYGNVAKVERCNMDGTNRSRLVDYKIEQPTAVALDVVKKLVYWADAYLDYIDVVDYHGKNRHSIIHGTQVSVTFHSELSVFVFHELHIKKKAILDNYEWLFQSVPWFYQFIKNKIILNIKTWQKLLGYFYFFPFSALCYETGGTFNAWCHNLLFIFIEKAFWNLDDLLNRRNWVTRGAVFKMSVSIVSPLQYMYKAFITHYDFSLTCFFNQLGLGIHPLCRKENIHFEYFIM